MPRGELARNAIFLSRNPSQASPAVNLLVSGVLRSLGWPRSVIRPQPTGGYLGTGEGDLIIGRNGASAAVKSLGF